MLFQGGKDPRILLLECLMCGVEEDIVQHLLLTSSDSYKKGRLVTSHKWIYIPLCKDCSEKTKSLNRKINSKVDKLKTVGYCIIFLAIFSIAINYVINANSNPDLLGINLFISFVIPVGAIFLLLANLYSKREYSQSDHAGNYVRFSGGGEVLVRPVHIDSWMEYNAWMSEVLSTKTAEDFAKLQDQIDVKPPPAPLAGKYCSKCDQFFDTSGNFCGSCGNLLVTRRV